MFNCCRRKSRPAKSRFDPIFLILLILLHYFNVHMYINKIIFQLLLFIGKDLLLFTCLCSPNFCYHISLCISHLISSILLDRLILSLIIKILLLRAGIEPNPGPIPRK